MVWDAGNKQTSLKKGKWRRNIKVFSYKYTAAIYYYHLEYDIAVYCSIKASFNHPGCLQAAI